MATSSESRDKASTVVLHTGDLVRIVNFEYDRFRGRAPSDIGEVQAPGQVPTTGRYLVRLLGHPPTDIWEYERAELEVIPPADNVTRRRIQDNQRKKFKRSKQRRDAAEASAAFHATLPYKVSQVIAAARVNETAFGLSEEPASTHHARPPCVPDGVAVGVLPGQSQFGLAAAPFPPVDLRPQAPSTEPTRGSSQDAVSVGGCGTSDGGGGGEGNGGGAGGGVGGGTSDRGGGGYGDHGRVAHRQEKGIVSNRKRPRPNETCAGTQANLPPRRVDMAPAAASAGRARENTQTNRQPLNRGDSGETAVSADRSLDGVFDDFANDWATMTSSEGGSSGIRAESNAGASVADAGADWNPYSSTTRAPLSHKLPSNDEDDDGSVSDLSSLDQESGTLRSDLTSKLSMMYGFEMTSLAHRNQGPSDNGDVQEQGHHGEYDRLGLPARTLIITIFVFGLVVFLRLAGTQWTAWERLDIHPFEPEESTESMYALMGFVGLELILSLVASVKLATAQRAPSPRFDRLSMMLLAWNVLAALFAVIASARTYGAIGLLERYDYCTDNAIMAAPRLPLLYVPNESVPACYNLVDDPKLVSAPGCDLTPPDGYAPLDDDGEELRRQKAIKWLKKTGLDVDDGWGLANASRFHHFADDDDLADDIHQCVSIQNFRDDGGTRWLPQDKIDNWFPDNIGFCVTKCESQCNCAKKADRAVNATMGAFMEWMESNTKSSPHFKHHKNGGNYIRRWGLAQVEIYSDCAAFDKWKDEEDCSANGAANIQAHDRTISLCALILSSISFGSLAVNLGSLVRRRASLTREKEGRYLGLVDSSVSTVL